MLQDTFANRLNKALKLRNMRPTDLAYKTGFGKSLISGWLSGQFNARQDKLTILAKTLNVSESWLMGFDVSMEREWISNDLKVTNPDLGTFAKTMVKIPVLGRIPAGTPIEAIEDILGYEEIPVEWTKGNKKWFGLKIDGKSMYPKYETNDIIIVLQQSDCESGQDCVVIVNGNDATFKRVIKQDDNIILKPLNNEYEPTLFTAYDILSKPVRILGVAKELRRKTL